MPTPPRPAFPVPTAGRRAACLLALACATAALPARQWTFLGIPEPLEAEFVAMNNDMVVLRGANGTSCEVPLARFSEADRKFLALLARGQRPADAAPGAPLTRRTAYQVQSHESLAGRMVTLEPASELHLTGTGDPLTGSSIHFTAPDGWLFLDRIPPSVVAKRFLDRFLVRGARAVAGENLRLAQYGAGTAVIPHPPDFPALTIFAGRSLAGKSLPLTCYAKHGPGELDQLGGPVASFVLRRGYMATLAEHENGTGASRNYVAQDHDLLVDPLPKDLAGGIRFARVFPWRWVPKKGVAGAIHQNLNVGWFYDWNIGAASTPDLEYVGIRQNRWWPGLDQDWRTKGTTHLLGYNEPDRPDQAKMSVADALHSWPDLLATGLRLGAPATSDGGLAWLYEFITKADKAGLRVDFVPVHYYRATGDPGDPRAAAEQLRRFLAEVHERVQRPLWVTEWNNGANWTKAPDPTPAQQKAAIAAMIEMLDETPYVERYALYNWVEDCRALVLKDGSLTPAGEVYRDHGSPLSFTQPKSSR